MANSINASISGTGGIIYTADSTGILNLQSNGTTRLTVSTTANTAVGVSGDMTVVGVGYSPTITLTDASSISWDTSLGQTATVTLGGNRTFSAPTGMHNGAFYSLAVYQDSTGNKTLSWNSVFKFASGVAPVLSTSASSKDFFVFRSDGTYLYEQGRALGDA